MRKIIDEICLFLLPAVALLLAANFVGLGALMIIHEFDTKSLMWMIGAGICFCWCTRITIRKNVQAAIKEEAELKREIDNS